MDLKVSPSENFNTVSFHQFYLDFHFFKLPFLKKKSISDPPQLHFKATKDTILDSLPCLQKLDIG